MTNAPMLSPPKPGDSFQRRRQRQNNMGQVKVKGRDDGCCGLEFLKYVMFIFNFMFWVSTSYDKVDK